MKSIITPDYLGKQCPHLLSCLRLETKRTVTAQGLRTASCNRRPALLSLHASTHPLCLKTQTALDQTYASHLSSRDTFAGSGGEVRGTFCVGSAV